jgi:hypothetical protein
MFDAGKELLVIRHIFGRNHTVCVLFELLELLRESGIMFGGNNLHRHSNVVDLLLREPRGMLCGDAIYKMLLRSSAVQ